MALHKDHGGTTNVLLAAGDSPAVPGVAAARSSVAETGAMWTGYRRANAQTGPVAVVTSHEVVGPGQELFYADVFTRGGGQANVHLTVTAATRAVVDAIAQRIVTTIRPLR